MSKIVIVRKEGGSRVIAVTKVIPVDWIAVELEVVKTTQSCITVKINKVK